MDTFLQNALVYAKSRKLGAMVATFQPDLSDFNLLTDIAVSVVSPDGLDFNQKSVKSPGTFYFFDCCWPSADLNLLLFGLSRNNLYGGLVYVKVPLGWKRYSDNHFFFSEYEIFGLLDYYGFDIVSSSLITGANDGVLALGVIAVARGEDPRPLLDSSRFRRTSFNFIGVDDASFEFEGRWRAENNVMISQADFSSLAWQGDGTECRFICEAHRWSGIASFNARGKNIIVDLFRWHSVAVPVDVSVYGSAQMRIRATGSVIGRNPFSRGKEMVLHGVLVR